MFGRRDELAALRARVDQLAAEVERLRAATAMARSLLDDAGRLAGWAEEAPITGVDCRRGGHPPGAERRGGSPPASLSRPAQQGLPGETPGYVSLFFVGGQTGHFEILVGSRNPPTGAVAIDYSGDGYAGTIVRAGEFWMLQGRANSRAVFTPLF
jgi:hypothetical protein